MTALLDTIVSLCLIYLVFAIVVSGVQEWVAQAVGSRGKFLRLGLSRLIDDEAITTRVLQHPLIGNFYRDPSTRTKPPSYVDATNFVLALSNVIIRRANPPETTLASAESPIPSGAAAAQPLSYANLRVALKNLAAQRSPLASALLPIVDRAEENLDRALKGMEEWYANGMDRVSGWYKAYAQKNLFLIGFLAAVFANVDSIEIFQTLNRSPDLRAEMAKLAADIGQSGKIGGVDVTALRDRPPTEAEWRQILKTTIDTSESGVIGRLPIGYGCLGVIENFPTLEHPPSQGTPGQAGAGTGTATPTGQSAAISTSARVLSTTSTVSVWNNCREQLKLVREHTSISGWLLKLLGFVLTAFAAVLGAPYWFAALSKIVNIRGSGPKPEGTAQT